MRHANYTDHLTRVGPLPCKVMKVKTVEQQWTSFILLAKKT